MSPAARRWRLETGGGDGVEVQFTWGGRPGQTSLLRETETEGRDRKRREEKRAF